MQKENRPNIVLLISDQQRWDSVGYVNPLVSTPNIDTLASKSQVFTTAIVQSPQCQPSRASLLTGRYPTAHKLWYNNMRLSPSEVTIGNLLRNAGYRTGYFGKMHISGSGTHIETAKHFGFDDAFLHEDWVAFTKDKTNARHERHRIRNEFYSPMATRTWTGSLTQRKGHHEDVVTDLATRFMQKSEPYFAVVGFYGPHPPYAAPMEFSNLYHMDDIPSLKCKALEGPKSAIEWCELKRQYYGMCSWIDDNVGTICKAAGDNTIIIYTSDHGDILGDHGLFSKGMYAYEGVVRVPLIVYIPGKQPKVYKHIVESIDIAPTILSELRLAIPRNIQGRNLFHKKREALSMIGADHRLRMVRLQNYKYWIYNQQEFLYDLTTDPEETNNLAIGKSDLLNMMRYHMINGLIRAEDPLEETLR